MPAFYHFKNVCEGKKPKTKCTSITDCLPSLTCCLLTLPVAIRQVEDSSELLEKTLLKLRLDQKGNGSIRELYHDGTQK